MTHDPPQPLRAGSLPGIAVLILTRNRYHLLIRVLSSVLQQVIPEDEILVMDTGSDQPEVRAYLEELAGQNPGGVRVFFEQGALDFAKARNRLAAEARRELVVFLDDDCIPREGWLEAYRQAWTTCPDLVAAGGLAVAPERLILPSWWEPGCNWVAGLTGPEILRSETPGYPSTSNMAVRRDALIRWPMGETQHFFSAADPLRAYLGMREDAHWWYQARLRGDRLTILSSAVVDHEIPEQRLEWKALVGRARLDGMAAWSRRHHPAVEEFALGQVANLMLKRWFGHASRADRLWCERQWGVVLAAASREANPSFLALPSSIRKRLLRSLWGGLKQRGLVAWFQVLRSRARKNAIPRPRPGERVALLAPTHVGDHIVLQPVVRALAEQLAAQGIELLIWCRHPRLLGDLPENVRWVDQLDSATRDLLAGSVRIAVPYYSHGDLQVWRTIADRAGTFDHEVGFSRFSDTQRAGMILPKTDLSHEVDQVTELVQWLLPEGAQPLELRPWRLNTSSLQPAPVDKPKPVALCLHTALSSKDWGLDRWTELARQLLQRHQGPLALIPALGREAEAELVKTQLASEGADIDQIACWTNLSGVDKLIEALATCRLVITGCSAPKHLAHALGLPVVCLYGPTRPAQWGPYFSSDRQAVVDSPGQSLTYEELLGQPENLQMSLITVEQVLKAFYALGDKTV
jgi:ADP-heptose:LPS heptosyltransferase/glycosyltransferase involved in cell wall biosynthesis